MLKEMFGGEPISSAYMPYTVYAHFMQDAGSLTCNALAGKRKDAMVAAHPQVPAATGVSHQAFHITNDGSPTWLADICFWEKVWNVT